MKKFFSFILISIVLLQSVIFTCQATDLPECHITDNQTDQVQAGDTIVLSVFVSEEIMAQAGGISVEYDDSVLIFERGNWCVKDAILSTFDIEKGKGTFLMMNESNLEKGKVAELVFKILDDPVFTNETLVTLNLIFKNTGYNDIVITAKKMVVFDGIHTDSDIVTTAEMTTVKTTIVETTAVETAAEQTTTAEKTTTQTTKAERTTEKTSTVGSSLETTAATSLYESVSTPTATPATTSQSAETTTIETTIESFWTETTFVEENKGPDTDTILVVGITVICNLIIITVAGAVIFLFRKMK